MRWLRRIVAELLKWMRRHPLTVSIAVVVGIVSGLFSNTFPDYTGWEALATGFGMFFLVLEVAHELIFEAD